MARQEQHDRVVFENVANQYVEGEDVTAFFTISNGIEVNPNEDQIGLLRVGCVNLNKSVAYASVKFNPSTRSGPIRYGTATFSSSSLPVTSDEFYQFCYINKNTILGSSVPFQLNYTWDDIDYLSDTSLGKRHDLITIDHNDHDDIVVIHSKRVSTEEDRQLSNKQDPFESSKKTSITQSSECFPYFHGRFTNESDQLRSQLSVTIQLTKDQATQIVDLERRLMQADQLTKQSNQRQSFLEQQLRDLNLTSEKHQRSLQGQMTQSSNQRQLQLERQLRDLMLTSEKYQHSVQGQLNAYAKQAIHSSKTQIPIESNEQAYTVLKNSFNTIEKRCIKHQKTEIDLKRQLMIHQKFVNDLQVEIQHLTERLSTTTEEYDTLFSKYNALESKMERKYEQLHRNIKE